MKPLKSQNGYALLLILLMIVLFSVIGLSLFTININNSKQVSVTKQDMQAIDIAEMGAVQYKDALYGKIEKSLSSRIQNELYSLKENEVITANEIIESIINKNYGKYPANDFIVDELINKKIPAWNSSVYTQTYEIISTNQDIVVLKDENGKYIVEIKFRSLGVNQNRNATIDGELILPLESIIQNSLSISTVENNEDFKHFTFLLNNEPNLISINNCSNTSNTLSESHSCINYTGTINPTSNNSKIENVNAIIKSSNLRLGNSNQINNSTLILNGTLSGGNNSTFNKSYVTILPGNGKVEFNNGINFSNTTFHSYKSFEANNITSNSSSQSDLVFHNGATLKQINDDFKNVSMYVNEDLSINAITGNKKILNSTFYVNNDFKLNSLQGKVEDSMIYIVNDFNGGNIKINNIVNSTICVGGNIKIDGQIVNPSGPFKKVNVEYSPDDSAEEKTQKLVKACNGLSSKETTMFQNDLDLNLDNTKFNYN